MSPSSSASGYHAYEVIISYQAVVDAGVKAPLNATELSSFQEKVYRGEPPRYRCHLGRILLKMPAISLLTGVVGLAGHETRVRRTIVAGIWVTFFQGCQQ